MGTGIKKGHENDIRLWLKEQVEMRIRLIIPTGIPPQSILADQQKILKRYYFNEEDRTVTRMNNLPGSRPLIYPGTIDFIKIANAIACLAFQEEGITILGLHFQSKTWTREYN